MPRIRYSTFPRGLFLNTTGTLAPEGTLSKARNIMSIASNGYLRAGTPLLAGIGTPACSKSRTKFNGRFINRGEVVAVQRIERETTVGGGAFAAVTLPADSRPALTLRSSNNPMLFCSAQPTTDKDEQLFLMDTGQSVGDNSLLRLNDAGVLHHWGILPPTNSYFGTVTAAVNAQASKYINTVAADPIENAADWTLATADETALGAFTAIDTIANPAVDGNSIRFRVDKDDSAQMTRSFGSNIDLTTFGASASSDEDFIMFFIRVRRPKHIQSIEIAFDTTAAGDFKKDFFSREVTVTLVKRKKRRKLIGLGDLIPDNKLQDYLKNQSTKTTDLTFSEDTGNQTVFVSKNTWSRVTLPKNTFDQSGSPNWSTVRAIRITVQSNKEGKTAVFFDSLQIVGGAGMHGDYEYTLTFSTEDGTPSTAGSMSNPPIDDDVGTASGLRDSVLTVKVPNVERQSINVTLPAIAAPNWDPQISRIYIWRTVGNGHAFFRAGYITTTVDSASFPGATFTDSAADYYGLNSNAAAITAGSNHSFAVLDPTLELPLDNTSPNDPAFAFQDMIDRPHLGRMWWGRNIAVANETHSAQGSLGNYGQIYFSPPGRLEAVESSVFVTSGVTDPVQKLVVWNDRLFVLTSSAMYEVIGTDEPFFAQRIEGAPGTIYPYSVQATSIGIIYLSHDGIYKFNGQYAESITDNSLLPVFRHRLATGELTLSAVSTLVRSMWGRNAYYMGPNFIDFTLVYDFDAGAWRYMDAANSIGVNSGAMYFDPPTSKLFVDSTSGGSDNTEIEAILYPTSSSIQITVAPLPHYRSGPGKFGILRKLWFDISLGPNGSMTGGGAMQPSIIIDGTTTLLATISQSAATRVITEYNLNSPGEVFAVEATSLGLRDVQINAVEMDIYVPGDTDEAPG